MSELSVTGTIAYINPITDVSKTDKPFLKCDFGIDTSVNINGTTYESFVSMQAIGDKTELLSDLNIGDKVQAFFGLKGNLTTKSDLAPTEKNPKSVVVYTNLSCYKIDVLERAAKTAYTEAKGNSPAPASAPAPVPAPEKEEDPIF